ncbi:VOC family protein [Priestia megaterium]|uniref:VOC family protein n=1 Tax=Priestia megaterium TaxID=1404 RepID=UPI00249BF41C|nr:VOC family protein [Priestia megaterium]MDI3089924.1 VOC family protein [Priestia megaterium]
MSKVKLFKLGFVDFATRDVGKLKNYYTEIMGYKFVEQDKEGKVYLSNGLDHHNIVVSPCENDGAQSYGYQLDGQMSLEDVQKQLKAKGIDSSIKRDAKPGLSEFLELTDPAGNLLQLYLKMDEAAVEFGSSGIIPFKLGHVAFHAENYAKTIDFYQEALGFHFTDMIGPNLANFLTCNADHHVINIVKSNQTKLHHIAFQLKDASHHITSADYLVKNGYPILWGPSRHTAGHNIASYHHDPDKNLIELYTDMDIYIPELNIFEPRPWHKELPQKPKQWNAVSSWETEFTNDLGAL